MRGITPVISVILLMLIAVTIAGVVFAFLTGLQTRISSATQQQLENTVTGPMAFSIDQVSTDAVYVRNRGTRDLNTKNMNLYVDGLPFAVSPTDILPGTVGSINFSDGVIPAGTYSFRLRSATFSDSRKIEVLPGNVIRQPTFENTLREPLDVMLVLDRSGSMTNDCGSDQIPQPGETPCKINDMKTAAKSFVDMMYIGDRMGVTLFNETDLLLHGLSPDKNSIKAAIESIAAAGYAGTSIGYGIENAMNEILNNPRITRKFEIVLTDGRENEGSDPVGMAAVAGSDALVQFDTDVPTSSYIEFGSTEFYGKSTPVYGSSTSHLISLIGLLKNRTYHYRIHSKNGAGYESVSDDIVFSTGNVTDVAAPTVSITSPSNGATVSGIVTVRATASDDTGILGVQFRIDGNNFSSEDQTWPYTASLDSAGQSNGVHALTAVARDASGRTATSSTISINIQNAAVNICDGIEMLQHFDQNASTITDSSGYGKDGLIPGAYRTTGRYGNGLNFSGGGLVNTSGSSLNMLGSFTFEAWINPSALSGWQTIFMKEDDDGSLGYFFGAENARLVSGFYTEPEASCEQCGRWWSHHYASGLQTGTWQHVAAVFNDATDNFVLYINGNPVLNEAETHAQIANNAGLLIGTNINGNDWTGLVDELRMYNRALTQAEIQADMNAAISVQPGGANLVLAMGMDESSGTITYDKSSRGNNGTLSRGPAFTNSGKFSGAYNFDGIDDYIRISKDGAFDTLSEGTLATWVKSADSSWRAWFSMQTYGFELGDGRFLVWTWECAGGLYGYTSIPSNPTDWHQLVYTAGPGGNAFYIDGQRATVTYDSGSQWTDNFFSSCNWGDMRYEIGTHVGYSSEAFFGTIDEMAIWSRPLSAQEIQTMYANNAPLPCTPDITPPTVAITSPSSGATVSSYITINATASDSGRVTGVQFKIDGDNISTEDTEAPYSVGFYPSLFTEGTHTLTAVARDLAGNVATSPGITINVQTTNLILALGFNEGSGTTAGDSSGNGNSGEIFEATWTGGKYGNALNFDGVNDWVTVADSSSLDITKNITVEAWVNITSSNQWQTIMMKETNAMYYLYAVTNPNPAFGLNIGGYQEVYGRNAIPLNTWTHVAGTWNGTRQKIYVNGVNVRNRTQTGIIGTSTDPLRIGGNTGWGEYLGGSIDEVRIYGRTLTEAEIRSDMNTPIPPPMGGSAGDRTGPVIDNVYTEVMPMNNITIYTIGLGNDVDSSMLDTIAKIGGGRYFFATDGSQLASIFANIGEELGEIWLRVGIASIDNFGSGCESPERCARFTGSINSNVYQNIRIFMPGSYTATASAMIKTSGAVCTGQCAALGGETCSSNDGRIRIIAYDGADTVIGQSTSEWASTRGTGWVNVQRSWKTPDGTAKIRFQVEPGDCCSPACSVSEVYVDDTSMQVSK